MTRPAPLPEDLHGRPFDRTGAVGAGARPGRLRRKDLLRPFHGVRVAEVPRSTLDRCRAYAVRLKPGQFFSHETAAALHGLPLPQHLEEDPTVHVAAVLPADAPHSRGMRGHRLTAATVSEVDGLPVADVLETFCHLGGSLDLEDLVVVADVLMNRTELEEDEARAVLTARIAMIRRRGAAKLVKAVHLCRRGSRSPAETRVRLILAAAGLPLAELNAPIEHSRTGRYLGSPDFVWRRQRVLLEYEGDGHRVSKEQFRYDIVRYDDLAADGWRVLRATADDLALEGRKRLVLRVRRALEASESR